MPDSPSLSDTRCVEIDLSAIDPEVGEQDERDFLRINDVSLSPEQVERIHGPGREHRHHPRHHAAPPARAT